MCFSWTLREKELLHITHQNYDRKGKFNKWIIDWKTVLNFQDRTRSDAFFFWKCRFAYEGTISSDKSFLSSDLVHKVDPNEVWKTPKGQVPLSLYSRVRAILIKFQAIGRYFELTLCSQIGLLITRISWTL